MTHFFVNMKPIERKIRLLGRMITVESAGYLECFFVSEIEALTQRHGGYTVHMKSGKEYEVYNDKFSEFLKVLTQQEPNSNSNINTNQEEEAK